MLDRDQLTDLIDSGRQRNASSEDIADEILARMEDPAWARAMSHPTRAAILRLMRQHGPMSPSKAVDLLDDVTLGTVSYHFRALLSLDHIELLGTEPRRGATEHFYGLVSGQTAAPPQPPD